MVTKLSGKSLTKTTRTKSDFGGRKGKEQKANCKDAAKRNT